MSALLIQTPFARFMIRLTFILAFALGTVSYAQTTASKPNGIQTEIDVARHVKVLEIFNGDDKALKDRTINKILSKPNDYNPMAMFAFSKELYDRGRKKEAVFWFYVAQLRGRYDGNLCLDSTARGIVAILTGVYGPEIKSYAAQNKDTLAATIRKVVNFVKTNEETYDHRWIYLQGRDAAQNVNRKIIIQPKDKWPAIKTKTIEDNYKGFIEYHKEKK